MSQARDNDDPRDAHLLAALRHAPDRDALPPREVSERILAAARAAVRAPAAAPWWQRLSAWLMQPQVAASFGTLVVASLVGVMWSTHEPPVAEVTPAEPIAGRVDQQATSAASATAAPAEAAKPDTGPVAAAPAPNDKARDKLSELPSPKAIGKDAAVRAESRVRPKAEPLAAPAAATTPPVVPPPAAAPSADAQAPAAAAAARPRANESDAQVLTRQQGAASARSVSEAAAGMTLAAKARVAEPLAAINAALAAGARWQVAGVAMQHGPAQQALWASVQEATRGRWEAAPLAAPPAPWLVLEQGSPRAVFWIIDGALYVTVDGRGWRAPVDAALLADWQAQVARW